MNKHEGRLFSMYSFDYVACQGINNNGAIGPLFLLLKGIRCRSAHCQSFGNEGKQVRTY